MRFSCSGLIRFDPVLCFIMSVEMMRDYFNVTSIIFINLV